MLTEKEVNLLNTIVHDEFTPLNGEEPETLEDCSTFVDVDSWSNNIDLSINECKGVLGSLVKKNIINIEDEDIELSLFGFNIYKREVKK